MPAHCDFFSPHLLHLCLTGANLRYGYLLVLDALWARLPVAGRAAPPRVIVAARNFPLDMAGAGAGGGAAGVDADAVLLYRLRLGCCCSFPDCSTWEKALKLLPPARIHFFYFLWTPFTTAEIETIRTAFVTSCTRRPNCLDCSDDSCNTYSSTLCGRDEDR